MKLLELTQLNRRELQSLAKKYQIKANQSNLQLIQQLHEYHNAGIDDDPADSCQLHGNEQCPDTGTDTSNNNTSGSTNSHILIQSTAVNDILLPAWANDNHDIDGTGIAEQLIQQQIIRRRNTKSIRRSTWNNRSLIQLCNDNTADDNTVSTTANSTNEVSWTGVSDVPTAEPIQSNRISMKRRRNTWNNKDVQLPIFIQNDDIDNDIYHNDLSMTQSHNPLTDKHKHNRTVSNQSNISTTLSIHHQSSTTKTKRDHPLSTTQSMTSLHHPSNSIPNSTKRSKFDLGASLNKPLTWQLKTGVLSQNNKTPSNKMMYSKSRSISKSVDSNQLSQTHRTLSIHKNKQRNDKPVTNRFSVTNKQSFKF